MLEFVFGAQWGSNSVLCDDDQSGQIRQPLLRPEAPITCWFVFCCFFLFFVLCFVIFCGGGGYVHEEIRGARRTLRFQGVYKIKRKKKWTFLFETPGRLSLLDTDCPRSTCSFWNRTNCDWDKTALKGLLWWQPSFFQPYTFHGLRDNL